ncbi:unnamed protein product [Durusdinium trenchii]|uniref:Cyclin-like domain-containing protein n=1 Tax=Durusdinium trenchii TaxID=1381693 RepID=A0ABP0HWU1_9DINO
MVALVPSEVLAAPPSREDGIDEDSEDQLRRFGAHLIQRAGVLLRLPQLTVVAAAALFQRFYFRKSFAEFEVRVLAMAAVTLASKLQEHPRKVVEVIQVFYRLKMREVEEEDGSASYAGKPTPLLDPTKKEFHDAKKELLSAERNILRELGFEVNLLLDHPHRYAIEYIEHLQRPAELAQKVWNYLNDSLQTSLCCSHQPQNIAGASLVLASKDLGVNLPSKPPWWETFGVQIKDAELIASEMEGLYLKKAPEYFEVPRRKKEVFEPMTPCPSPPPCGPAKSPSDEEDHVDEGETALSRQDSTIDYERLAEVIAESETDFAKCPAGSPPGEELKETQEKQEARPDHHDRGERAKDRRKRDRVSESCSQSPVKRKSVKKAPEASRKGKDGKESRRERERRSKRSNSSESRKKKR